MECSSLIFIVKFITINGLAVLAWVLAGAANPTWCPFSVVFISNVLPPAMVGK
jgi:hypothetical protein